jgi:methionyl-tRNA synthetase
LVGGEKMSKTTGNVVNPLDLTDEFGIDGFRYYVLADTQYGSDGDFTYEGLVTRYNSDLANNLGNLAARVATVVQKKCAGVGTAPRADSPLRDVAQRAVEETTAAWNSFQPSRALEATWSLIHATNAFLESHEPWKAEPGPALDAVLGDALEVLRIVSILCVPAMPRTAQEVWRRIGMDGDVSAQRVPNSVSWGQYPAGRNVEKGDPLFPRKSK